MEITNITVSTSRKINHAVYGASDYEMSDKFVSLGAEIGVDDDVKQIHRELMLRANELCDAAVANEILKIQGGMGWKEYLELLRQYRLGHADINDEVTGKLNRLQLSVLEEFKKLKRNKKP